MLNNINERFKKRNDHGFTLFELMVSIGILLILSIGGIIVIQSVVGKSNGGREVSVVTKATPSTEATAVSKETEDEVEPQPTVTVEKTVEAEEKSDSDIIRTSINGLVNYRVYKHKGANLSEGKTVSENFSETYVGITVIPEKSIAGRNIESIAKAVKDGVGSDYDTIIVISDGDKDLFAVSSDSELKEIEKQFTKILGTSEVDDAGWTLVDKSSSLIQSYDDVKDQIKAEEDKKFTEGLMSFVKVVGIIILSIAFIVGLVVAIRKTIMSAKAQAKREKDAIRKSFEGYSSDFIDAIYAFKVTGEIHDHELTKSNSLREKIDEVYGNIVSLNDAIDEGNISNSQKISVQVEYADRLDKMNSLLGEEYYVNIVQNPDYWTNSQMRKDRVVKALDALNEQIIENIQQVNDEREIDFTVALQVILGDAFNESVENDSNKDNVSGAYNRSAYVSSKKSKGLSKLFKK